MRLTQPEAGTPEVSSTQSALEEAASQLTEGTGPVAVDAERAGSYRYNHRAMLVQIKRTGSGTFLLDPEGIDSFVPLQEAIGSSEWILHSANQDLPCLADLGLSPAKVFDTEIAAKLAGRERVGLASLVEQDFGLELGKGYGAADWSKRPIPPNWRNYAALDVELLIELREKLIADLESLGRREWAEQEFTELLAAPPKPREAEPWRATKRISLARSPRQLAIARALWTSRDELARSKDIAPIRIFRDDALMAVVTNPPQTRRELRRMPGFDQGRALSGLNRWWTAIEDARALPEDQLPKKSRREPTLPRANQWADKNPTAARRLALARELLNAKSEETGIPVENLVLPATVRELCWNPPPELSPATVSHELVKRRARPWQIDLAVPLLLEAWLDSVSLPADPISER